MEQGSSEEVKRQISSWMLPKKRTAASGLKLRLTIVSVAGLIALAALTGCSGFFTAVTTTGTTPGSTTYAYVTNIASGGSGGTLAAYSLTSGVLTAISGSPVTLSSTPTSIVVAPNNGFLYVATQSGIFLYTIGSGGVLTEGNSGTIVYLGPTYPVSLAMDSTSSWLIVANHTSTELDALPIDPTTGIPTTATPVAVTLSNPSPAQIAFSPANGTIAVALGSGGTNAWSFTASSSSPWGTTRNGINLVKGSTAANAVAFDTTSTYFFVAEATTGTTADVLRKFDLSTLTNEVDYPTGKGPSSILADLSGAYVYVSNQTDNNITGYSISAGVLTALADSPFSTGKAPVGLAEDSTKSYVLSVGFGANPDLWVYSFDATSLGTLDVTKTATTGAASPSQANAIALSH
jgi:6-phosphogluconolactonase